MTEDRELKLVKSWVKVQRNWWAWEELMTACEKHPRKAWRLLGHAADLATTNELIQDLGAGPLEDFIRYHAPRSIGQIEKRAREHPRFRRALAIAYLPDATDSVSERLFALGCRRIPTKREPWQS